jgi:hypothetical protein
MRKRTKVVVRVGILVMSTALASGCQSKPSDCGPTPSWAERGSSSLGEFISLSDRLAAGRVRSLNRTVTVLSGGTGLRVAAASGEGLIWLEGTDFSNGAIETAVCGRDIDSESFVGIAFHRRNDETYEAIYLRPFNFRSRSSDRRQHAVQYIAVPGNDYGRLRAQSPGEFEHAVDPSVDPNTWNRLRVVVGSARVQVFVGDAATVALDVRALQAEGNGQVGLFVGNGSDGVFTNLRLVRGSR